MVSEIGTFGEALLIFLTRIPKTPGGYMRLFMALTLMEDLAKKLEWRPSIPISPLVRHAIASVILV